MTKVEISTVINRPVEEVFAFAGNPKNDPKWVSASSEVKITSQGPIGVGTTYRSIRTRLGRRMEGEFKFTEYEPNRKYATKHISVPFPNQRSVTFERVESGTRVTVTRMAKPRGFLKLVVPLLASTIKRELEGELANLKNLMETHAL